MTNVTLDVTLYPELSNEREYDKKAEEIRKMYKELVDDLSEEEVRKRLVNYVVYDYLENEDDPYDEDDRY